VVFGCNEDGVMCNNVHKLNPRPRQSLKPRRPGSMRACARSLLVLGRPLASGESNGGKSKLAQPTGQNEVPVTGPKWAASGMFCVVAICTSLPFGCLGSVATERPEERVRWRDGRSGESLKSPRAGNSNSSQASQHHRPPLLGGSMPCAQSEPSVTTLNKHSKKREPSK
jgi:hypothetical protein